MRVRIFIGICCLSIANSLFCPIITLTIRSYPNMHKTIRRLKKAGGADHMKLSHMVNPSQTAGIFATYAGFLEASDHFGQIIFPRKQTNAELYMLITNHITPTIMFQQTVAHWERAPNTPAHMYKYTRISDPETNLVYWKVEEAPLSESLLIPIETLVVMAHPKNIFVPIGITLTDGGTNLLLPPIYARKGIDIINNSLSVLNLAHLFGQVHLAHTKKASYYASQLKD
jgi:hypothetical protein